MPINHLQLQPQIAQYGRDARFLHDQTESRLRIALDLLRLGGQGFPGNREKITTALESRPASERCALPAEEAMDAAYDEPEDAGLYCAIGADGSQILPDPHEALSVALVNSSLIRYQPGSGQAPSVDIRSRFLRHADGRIIMEPLPEEQVNLERDVAELELLAAGLAGCAGLTVALRDGPLELFHEPRQGKSFDAAFHAYLDAMRALGREGAILAGYIDKPRADLVVSMLPFISGERDETDLGGLSDTRLFQELLSPGQRSAIFRLRSPSSAHYAGELELHFFYLNPGSANKPWIARVEIPAWAASQKAQVNLLHRALLDQCRLMGQRPYPYILHRAHEEAVVRQDDKEQLLARLSFELQRQGLGISQPSHKLSAKNLPSRTRKAK